MGRFNYIQLYNTNNIGQQFTWNGFLRLVSLTTLNQSSGSTTLAELFLVSSCAKVLAVKVPQLLQKLSSFSTTLLDKELTPVPVVKDLGVLLDTCLSYNKHITKTASNCLFKLQQINRIKHLLDRKTLLLVINSFVFSKLQYCSTVWSNTSNRNIDKLQKVQNFAGRIILGLRKYDHISDGLRSLKWLPIREKLILNDATMMHKCINKLVPDYLADILKLRSQVHNRQTRLSGALDIPLRRLSTGQRSFAFRGVKLWNSLNDNLKCLKCPKNFRRHLASVLLGTLAVKSENLNGCYSTAMRYTWATGNYTKNC